MAGPVPAIPTATGIAKVGRETGHRAANLAKDYPEPRERDANAPADDERALASPSPVTGATPQRSAELTRVCSFELTW